MVTKMLDDLDLNPRLKGDLVRAGDRKALKQWAKGTARAATQRHRDLAGGDDLTDGSPDGQMLRLAGAARVRIRAAGARDLPETPPSGLLVVLRRWSRQHGPATATDDDTFMRRLLEHYGFAAHLTQRRREYLTKVLRLLQRDDQTTAVQREIDR